MLTCWREHTVDPIAYYFVWGFSTKWFIQLLGFFLCRLHGLSGTCTKYISKPDTWVQLTVRHFYVVSLHSDEEYCVQIFCIMKDLLRATRYVMRSFRVIAVWSSCFYNTGWAVLCYIQNLAFWALSVAELWSGLTWKWWPVNSNVRDEDGWELLITG